MKDIASVYIEKVILGKKEEIFQMSAVFNDGKKFKFITRYIMNPIRQAWNAVPEQEAFEAFRPILEGKKVILHNDCGIDLRILNRRWLQYFGQTFSNDIFDVSNKAKANGIKKTSVKSLCAHYGINIKNVKNLPSTVSKAQILFMVGVKMFNIGK